MVILSLLVLLLVASSHYMNGNLQLAGLFGGLLLFALAGLIARAVFRRKRLLFYAQLCSKKKVLGSGNSVLVDGQSVKLSDTLTYDEASIGLLLTSLRVRLPYRLREEQRPLSGFICVLVSLISGWWSITGPVETVLVLKELWLGGVKVSVAELIREAPDDMKNRLGFRELSG